MVTLRCDLHIHSNASADGHCPAEEILKTAKARGLDAVAITDHDTTAGALRALSLDTNILVIPGIEVSTKDGHVLVLGTTKEYAPGKDARETIAEAESDGCVTIIPHPFHYFRHAVGLRNKKALQMADGIEAYNSRYYVGTANRKAARIAKRYGKAITAGSDAHECAYVGFGENIIEAEERSVEAVLSALKAGRISARCTKTPVSTYIRQSKNNVKRKIKRRLCRTRSP